MADYTFVATGYRYVDFSSGTDAVGYGGSMTTPWKTLSYATTNCPNKAHAIIFRRGTQELHVGSNLVVGLPDGDSAFPNILCSWPRPASGYTGRFAANSHTVTAVSAANLTELGHQARYIIGPDGKKYLAAKVLASDSFMIDPEYQGDGVSGAPFTFTEDYLYPLLSTGIWGDTGAWNSDPPEIYSWACTTDHYLQFSSAFYMDKFNIAITGNSNVSYLVYETNPVNVIWYNSIFKRPNQNASIINLNRSRYKFQGCTFEGRGVSATSQYLWYINAGGSLHAKDCVFIQFGGRIVLDFGANLYFDNCKGPLPGYYGGTVGVDSLASSSYNTSIFTDCVFSGVSAGNNFEGYYDLASTPASCVYQVINHNRVPGNDFIFWPSAGSVKKVNPTLQPGLVMRPGGSTDYVLWPNINKSSTGNWGHRARDGFDSDDWNGRKILEYEFKTPSGILDIRLYAQSSGLSLTSDKFWLELGVCSGAYWTPSKTVYYKSSGGISARSGASDWSQYIYISGLNVPSGFITAKAFYAKYAATSYVFVDPLPEINFV